MAKNLLFIHVPKTAGLSVVHYFKNTNQEDRIVKRVWRHHETAAEIKEKIGAEEFDAALKFATVRDPLTRYASAASECKLRANGPKARYLAERNGKRLPGRLFQKQTDILYIDGELAVDKLFKFETDIPEDMMAWFVEQGLTETELPHRNKRKWRQELNEETEAFVYEHYAADFEAFGY